MAAPTEDRHELLAQLGARMAGGVGCPADGTHGRPGDDRGFEAQLVEGLEHQHVGETARRAPAERQTDAQARLAAALASALGHVLRTRDNRRRPGSRRLRGGGSAGAAAGGRTSAVWLSNTRASCRLSCALAGAAAASTFLKRWKSRT